MGLRSSINAKCKQCIYDPSNGGTWRQQVDACTVVSCPLFDVRPQSYVPAKVKNVAHLADLIEVTSDASTL